MHSIPKVENALSELRELSQELSQLRDFALMAHKNGTVDRKTAYSLPVSDLEFLARSLSASAAKLVNVCYTLSVGLVQAALAVPNEEPEAHSSDVDPCSQL